jgi:AcrR family transcriptional regulator
VNIQVHIRKYLVSEKVTRHDRRTALEKAMNLFWEQGFQGTSVKDLERALGMHPGSIYAAFGSKSDLFREALDLYSERSLFRLRQVLGSADSPLQAVFTYIRAVGEECAADRSGRACLLAKTVLELADRDNAAKRHAADLLGRVEAELTEALTEAQRRGEVAQGQSPGALARLVQVQILGMRAYAQRGVAPETQRELAALAVDALARMATADSPHPASTGREP